MTCQIEKDWERFWDHLDKMLIDWSVKSSETEMLNTSNFYFLADFNQNS